MKRGDGKDYLQTLMDMGDLALQAAITLKQTLTTFNPNTLTSGIERLVSIDSEAEKLRLELIRVIESDFITPVDRGDILAAAESLDDLSGYIIDILAKVRIYNIVRVHSKTLELAEIIINCCHEITAILSNMNDIKKSKPVYSTVKRIAHIEDTSCEMYANAVHELFTSAADMRYITSWTEIFAAMDRCCKACVQTANLIAAIIIRNR